MPIFKYGTGNVVGSIIGYYAVADRLAFESARSYAAAALTYYQTHQRDKGKGVLGEFWTNRTMRAATLWYSKAYRTPTAIGFFVAHSDKLRDRYGTNYAKYLEFYNDERFASLKPVMAIFVPPFLEDIKRIYNRRL